MPRRPSRPVDPTSDEAAAQRLTDTRKALGLTTTEMCRRMGSASHGSAYTNYEMGRRRVTLNYALILCSTCSLTLDWIYRGDKTMLPPDLREKITAIELGR